MSGILVILAVLILAAFIYLSLQYKQRDKRQFNRRNVFSRENNETNSNFNSEPVETVRLLEDEPTIGDSSVEPIIDEVDEPVEPPLEVGSPNMNHMPHVRHYAKPTSRFTFKKKKQEETSSLMSVSVMAHAGQLFSSYDLLQAITNAGFHFGAMNVFHRHEDFEGHGQPIFTLASAVSPGTFDLDNMGAFSTPGLTIFMDAAMHNDPKAVLNLMLDCAHQLSEEINGDLCESPNVPFTMESYKAYEKQCFHALAQRKTLTA